MKERIMNILVILLLAAVIYLLLEVNTLKKSIQIAVAQGGVTYGVTQLNLDKPLNLLDNIYINGRLGIKTTVPTTELDVRGNGYVSGGIGIGNLPTDKLDIDGAVVMRGIGLPAVSSAGTGKIVFNNNQFQVSENGAAFKALGGGSKYEVLTLDVGSYANPRWGTRGWSWGGYGWCTFDKPFVRPPLVLRSYSSGGTWHLINHNATTGAVTASNFGFTVFGYTGDTFIIIGERP